MKARKTTKEKKTGQTGRKTKPTAQPEAIVPIHVSGSAPEPITQTAPAPPPVEKKEPWEKSVPFAKDVKEQNLQVRLGDYTVSYAKVEAANKDQRWTVTDAAGTVVGQHSQYWPACLDARRRSLGK